jgi:ElaB/YqjD/DUF883 family membrane-anchored ribosome-binding protein
MTIIKLDGSKPASSLVDLRRPPSAANVPTPSSTCCVWTAGLLIWTFVIYIMTSPSHATTAAGKLQQGARSAIDDKLMSMASAIKEQRASLSQQMDDAMAKLNRQKEALLEKTGDAMPSINGLNLPGVVTKGHHEAEVAELIAEHEEAVAKRQDEYDKLKKQHEEEVSQLQDSIEQSKAEVEKLTKALGGLTIDPAKFCAECPFNFNGLRTTCGARRDFLMGQHGDSQEVAMEAVVQWDPNCLMKDRRRGA